MMFGTSIVKGFAMTLMIGVCVSMFTAITATRVLLHLIPKEWGMFGHRFKKKPPAGGGTGSGILGKEVL
jgi:hypothetical protein